MEDTKKNTVKALRILYPLWVFVGIFGIMYVPTTLIDFQDAQLTARQIEDNLLLYNSGILSSLTAQLLFIIIPLLLFRLFKSEDIISATAMVVLALVSVPITMYNETNKLRIPDFLDSPDDIMNALIAHQHGLTIAMIFWGLWLFPLGWLVYKSYLFPRVVGIFLIIAAVGYTLGSCVEILFDDFEGLKTAFEFMTFGEIIFVIWIVFFGASRRNPEPV